MSQIFKVTTEVIPPEVATEYVTDNGTAVPVANSIEILGNPPFYSALPVTGGTNIYTHLNDTNQIYISAIVNTGLTLPVQNISSSQSMQPTNTYGWVRTSLGAFTITLPNPTSVSQPLSVGQTFFIKDIDGDAASNNITISGNGYNIDGQASITLNQNYESVQLGLYFISGTWGWAIL